MRAGVCERQGERRHLMKHLGEVARLPVLKACIHGGSGRTPSLAAPAHQGGMRHPTQLHALRIGLRQQPCMHKRGPHTSHSRRAVHTHNRRARIGRRSCGADKGM